MFKNIGPDCICMGNLRTPYLFAILFCIARDPVRVQKLFNNLNQNIMGVYSLILYPDGKKRETIIDDYIPCFKSNQ